MSAAFLSRSSKRGSVTLGAGRGAGSTSSNCAFDVEISALLADLFRDADLATGSSWFDVAAAAGAAGAAISKEPAKDTNTEWQLNSSTF